MADGSQTLDLQVIQTTWQLASNARRQELDAYNAARQAHDLDGLQAHYQAYLKASEAVQAANMALEGNILNTVEARHDLELLRSANDRLSAAVEDLKNDAAALEKFTGAINLVVQILGALAMF